MIIKCTLIFKSSFPLSQVIQTEANAFIKLLLLSDSRVVTSALKRKFAITDTLGSQNLMKLNKEKYY